MCVRAIPNKIQVIICVAKGNQTNGICNNIVNKINFFPVGDI